MTAMPTVAEVSRLSDTTFAESEAESRIAGNFPHEVVVAQLDKILGSSTFVRSKRLGRFLRFTVEQCLEGRQGALKEYLVGVEVFNKLETFDPRIDSIVRVEARRLRSKLEKYYQMEGRDDAIVVQFRKGSYVPQILSREQVNSLGTLDGSGSRSARKSIAISRFNNLGVDPSYAHFCSGRVRKQGERLRISAQLIDTGNSMYIWSETYERDLADAFAVQDEISRSIVSALRREFQTS
jgi:hypothetical protein